LSIASSVSFGPTGRVCGRIDTDGAVSIGRRWVGSDAPLLPHLVASELSRAEDLSAPLARMKGAPSTFSR
jgi:hypothetical protein